jgi:serine/threonine-protein kinase
MKKCPKCGIEYPDATTLCPSDGVALETEGDSLLGQTLAGKYRIDERLSEGGMGAVYRGTHVLMDKTVAIKVLRPSLAADEKIVARFSREARAASRISHPNALSVTDFGEDENGIVFLVMEFLRGKTLKEVIREEGPMPLSRVTGIMLQIGGALEAAHAQGVVHRDLKSDNIMLINTPAGDYAKVLDFGIAKIKEPEGEFDPGLTAPNLVIGTPQYMSPEQCSQAADIDARSDIYSFGVILYEMLVGHVPFTGESPTAIMMKHLQDPAPSVLDERDDLPPAIGRIVSRAMAKRPEERYQRIEELIEDLAIAGGVQGNTHSSVVAPETSRIIAPPASYVTSDAAADADADEVTVVRPRVQQVSVPRAPVTAPLAPVTVASQPPAGASFSPVKILIPAAAALLVVFAVIYAFTRNSGPGSATNANQPQSTLAADPNGQPVTPAQSPTGKSEEGIPSGGAIKPAANENTNTNSNANAQVSPTPLVDINEPPPPSANVNENANSNRKAPPVPSPSRMVLPEDAPPPPSPSGTKPPATNPSPGTPAAAPTGPPQ